MNILHIVPSYYPAIKYGGPIQSVFYLNRALVKKGVNVDVLTTTSGLKNHEGLINSGWINDKGVRIKYLPYYFYEHYTFSPMLLFQALSECKKHDLVHITAIWNFPVLAGSVSSLLAKKPYVISPRGMLHSGAIDSKLSGVKKVYYNLIAKHYLDRASAVHFTTEDEKNNVASFLSVNRSFVVPNGIDLDIFRHLPEEGIFKSKYPILKDKKYILFVGRINKNKGLEILVSAFEKLINDNKDLYLVLVGPDEGYIKTLQSILKSKCLLDRTLFTGILDGYEKLSAYVDAEAFIAPSYFENFSMSVVEAMACKKPVIISNKVGIYKEVEKANAGIVVNLDSQELYFAIKKLLENTNYRDLITANVRKLIEEKYDIEIVADMMINEYRKIIK